MTINEPKTEATLLLIDDDPNLVILVKDYLELRGFSVQTARNGKEALDQLEKPPLPDLIICDIMMPEMDGYGFVQHLRSQAATEWIPLIFLSAKSQTEDRIVGLRKGADVYMIKPFNPDELVSQIQASLQQAERLRRHQAGPSQSVSPLVPTDVSLTPTERKVVGMVAKGLSNREIAEHLQVSQRTVESHVSNMLGKTGLHNRTELARWAIEQQLAL